MGFRPEHGLDPVTGNCSTPVAGVSAHAAIFAALYCARIEEKRARAGPRIPDQENCERAADLPVVRATRSVKLMERGFQ